MTTLWVLSGGIEAVPVIRRAQEMGLRVIASDLNPTAPGLRLADEPVIADVYDPSDTVRVARRFATTHGAPDGILCAAADAPHTAAQLIEEFGLRGVSAEAAELATDKLAMKRHLRAAGIPVPWFHEVKNAAHLEELVHTWPGPFIVKPVDSRGARGVVRLGPGVASDWAFESAEANSPTRRVMVERFLDGPQISTESLVQTDSVATPGFADRNYEHLERFAPFVVENGGELPSRLDADAQRRVRDAAEGAARALDVGPGVAKGDLVLHEGEAYVIEIAARLSGGYFCSHHIPLATGVDFVGAAIRVALGETVAAADLEPVHERGVAQRFLFPEPGRVTRVEGFEEVEAQPEIALAELRVRVGQTLGAVENHPARAGLVIATGATREDAIRTAEDAVARIHIETRT